MPPTIEIIASIIAGAGASRLLDDLRLRIPLPTPEAQAAASPVARLGALFVWAPAYARLTAMFSGAVQGIGGAACVAILTGQIPLSPEATLIAALLGAIASQVEHAGTLSRELPETPAAPNSNAPAATDEVPGLHTRIDQRLRERPSIRAARAREHNQ